MRYVLEAFNTDARYRDDVRYRAYTTSKGKADAFNLIPKIQFTDSGHGIVFHAREMLRGERRLAPRSELTDYVNEHLTVEAPRG